MVPSISTRWRWNSATPFCMLLAGEPLPHHPRCLGRERLPTVAKTCHDIPPGQPLSPPRRWTDVSGGALTSKDHK